MNKLIKNITRFSIHAHREFRTGNLWIPVHGPIDLQGRDKTHQCNCDKKMIQNRFFIIK